MSWYYEFGDDADYDGDYEEIEQTADAIVIRGPVKAAGTRGEIGSTWWAQQWVAAMLRLGDARLDRGRRYARNGSVLSLTIQHGVAFSRVQGHYDTPYQSSVELKRFTREEWDKALDALAGQAIYAAKLLSGEMPSDIEAVFQSVGLSLFPRSRKDIGFECSCPDWGGPCKHAAAVYYLVADQLDVDPFILFHLRGYTREQVLDGLRRRRGTGDQATQEVVEQAAPQAPRLDADLAAFWVGSSINLVSSAPVIPARPPMLAQLGAPPAGIGKDLEQVYTRVSQTGLAWLGREEKVVETNQPGRVEPPIQAEEAYEYLRQISQGQYIADVSDIPHMSEQEKRLEAITVDAYEPEEELGAFEVYLSDALKTPFKAIWRDPDEPGHSEPVVVLGVYGSDDRRGVLLSVKRGDKKRRIPADQVWAVGKGTNATVLDDYRAWGGPMGDYDEW